MDREHGNAGNVAALLLQGRKAAALSQVDLAQRAGVSRARIIAAEARTSVPTLDLCSKMAAALDISLDTMARAHVMDSLLAANPEAGAKLEEELWEGNAHWKAIADHHGLKVERGRYVGRVSTDGDLTISRKFTGCHATRPRRVLLFRDRIVGGKPPDFAVKGTPKGLGCSMNISIEGEWAQHRVEFHRPWQPEDGPLEFEFETVLPRAYMLDLEEHNRRRRTEGLPALREFWGDYRVPVTYAFEKLELGIVFPENYKPAWTEPTATWGNAPLGDYDYHMLTPRSCRKVRFKPGSNEARLVLERPSPGYTFGVRWSADPEWMAVPAGEAK